MRRIEAAGYKGAGGVAAGEEVVGSAWAVEVWGGGDVVDGAVEGEVDGDGGEGAVVEGEFGGGEGYGTALCVGLAWGCQLGGNGRIGKDVFEEVGWCGVAGGG